MSKTRDILFSSSFGQVRLTLNSRSDGNVLRNATDAEENCEAPWQIGEGSEYDYEFASDCQGRHYQFEELAGIVTRTWIKDKDKQHIPTGTIKTGNNVGTMTLKVVDLVGEKEIPAGELHLEVVSAKMDYRSDYRQMMEDITKDYTELVMTAGPVSQKFKPDPELSPKALYQRFAFVKSIVDNESFTEAVHKVSSSPIHRWEQTTICKSITSANHLDRKALRQIATDPNRIPIDNEGLSIPQEIHSLPRTVNLLYKKDSIDTPENRFVKYVIKTFLSFAESFQSIRNAGDTLKAQASQLADKLRNLLSSSFFKSLSDLDIIALNSPALQQKDGYRDILTAWVLFDTAAKLTWTGGDDVYDAGKKNIAALYEYWLFFKLLDIISDIFKIEPKSIDNIIKCDSDGINLDLRQGQEQMIAGSTTIRNRKINVQFLYNKTFHNESDLSKEGSWTIEMRPDYTLSFWPGELSKKEAEADDVLTYIHFDAKYKVAQLPFDEAITAEANANLADDPEKAEQEALYKRVDILKMHAYKDAIRRTSGAYILYPGTKDKELRGYHEILPGLGAFNIRPAKYDEDAKSLKKFIGKVVNHLINRTSRREKVAVLSHQIQSTDPAPFYKAFPESNKVNGLFPDTTFVLIGCFKNQSHLEWIDRHGCYNLRMDKNRLGSVKINSNFVNAKYLILYDFNDKSNKTFYKIIGDSPEICTAADLGYDYPNPGGAAYLIFKVSKKAVEKELLDTQWNAFEALDNLVPADGSPVIIEYSGLFPTNPPQR